MTFRHSLRVGFQHCDPAGIVFFPRYLEMANEVMETFFREAVLWPYEVMMDTREGVPTARIEADFRAPSRLGEVLDWDLCVTRLGATSATFRLQGGAGGARRLTLTLTLVHVGGGADAGGGRPLPWPHEARARLQAHEEAPT